MVAGNRGAFYRYHAVLWGVWACLVAVMLAIAYGRNDQIYAVISPPSAEYPLVVRHSDLKSALPPGAFCQDIEGGLRIYSNTYWSLEVDFPRSGSIPVSITARGTAVRGGFPLVTITLDYDPPVMMTIDASDWRTFRESLKLSAGKHVLTIAFVNDAFKYPEDRNLDIREVCIGGMTPGSLENTDEGLSRQRR